MIPAQTRSHIVLSQDESCNFLSLHLRAQRPFILVRYGDGALECMAGKKGATCDREQYSEALGRGLRVAWEKVIGWHSTFVGNWSSASFSLTNSHHTAYEAEYTELLAGHRPTFLHFESLLLMRRSEALVNFYKTVQADSRRKLYMGPAGHVGAAKMLGADHLITPMGGVLPAVGKIRDELTERDFDVLLWGAGMASYIPVVQHWEFHRDRTYINLGSAMDPLFTGKTRIVQLSAREAREMFKELL